MRTARIKRLREAALSRQVEAPWTRRMLWGESWRESIGDLWWIRRRGRACRHVLEHIPLEIGPDELLIGRAQLAPPTAGEAQRLAAADEFIGHQPRVCGQTCHMAVDNEKLLACGALGVRDEILQYKAALDPADPDDLEKDAFYEACLEALEGLLALGRRLAVMARDAAQQATDTRRREELLNIAEICDHVPAHPARTTHEALQSVHLLTIAMVYGEGPPLFNPGRMDRWLFPYYQNDLKAGRITPEAAQELINCYYVLINEYVPRGLAIGVMVGGTDAAGRDVTNDISYMCLQAVDDVALAYPGVGVCLHDGTPEDLLALACRVMSKGRANPAVFNDSVICEGLKMAGCSDEQACMYINSSCVEITPIGSSNVWVASPYYNLTGLLVELIDDIADGNEPRLPCAEKEPPAWPIDDLITVYKERLSAQVQAAVAVQNTCRASRKRNGGFPLQSCFINDCLARGKDIDQGGARHNWIECSFVGLANLVDSLTVINRLVLNSGSMSLHALRDMLRTDFAGAESTRQLCLRQPKYGNDDEEVDRLAVLFTQFFVEECARYRVGLDDRYYPGLFCWVMHQRLGSETGASPDGRRAGFPFADGAGPAQGRELHGPTAAIKSVTCWDHTPMLGGLVLNLKFSPSVVSGAEGQQKLADLITAYMRLGGQEVQVNVVRREDLLAARDNPEQYRDLLVRVAGYTDYFTGLCPEMQEEVITRTEFGDL